MKITKKFVNNLYGFTENSYGTPNIQTIRLYMYIFSNWNDTYQFNTTMTDLYREVFKYKDENNKERRLMSWNDFKTMCYKMKLFIVDNNRNIKVTFNNDFFKINGTKKQLHDKRRIEELKKDPYYARPEYEEGSYYNLNDKYWEQIRTKNEFYFKIFFYLLYEKMRGPFQYIKTDIETLEKMLLNKDSELRRFKSNVKEKLEYFREIGFIKEYSFNKNKITITKY